METITIKLSAFEGPFDLLYHLIEKNEIDIYDIPIVTITEQYLQYLNQAEYRNMDGMSEFLLMAATLLEIKSKMLLPKSAKEDTQTEIDPRQELVTKLIEYKKFKNVAQQLKQRQESASMQLYKEVDIAISKLFPAEQEQGLESFLHGLTMRDIYLAFEDVMKRKEKKIDKIRSSFRSVERDLYTIEEKISFIEDLLIVTPKVSFQRIFREDSRKLEVVVTFLALLELIKLKHVMISQDKNFSEILIMRVNGSEKHETIRTRSGY